MIYTAFCLPVKEIGNVEYYDDVESYEFVRVLRGRVSPTTSYSTIRLKCVRFSVFYPEQFQDTFSAYAMTPKTVENLPYMFHFKWTNVTSIRNELVKQVLRIPNARENKVGGQPDLPVNAAVVHDGNYIYSTHASLKSTFQYEQIHKQHLNSDDHQIHDQVQYYYELDRNVVLFEGDIMDGQVLEFEVVLTNGRGKRIVGWYLPPVELEFEVE